MEIEEMSPSMDIIRLTVHFKVDVTFVAIMIWGCQDHTSVHKLVLCSDLVYHQGSWIFKSKVTVLVESVFNFPRRGWAKPAGYHNRTVVAVIKSLYPHRSYLFATRRSIVPGQSDSGAVVTHHDNSWVQRLFSEGKGCICRKQKEKKGNILFSRSEALWSSQRRESPSLAEGADRWVRILIRFSLRLGLVNWLVT